MMNPVIKQMWLNALRSGDYEQGRKRLVNFQEEYCCLGVLCNILDLGRDTRMGSEGFIWREEFNVISIPFALTRHVGVSPRGLITGLWDRDEDPVHLDGLNDSGFTFSQIADIIDYFL